MLLTQIAPAFISNATSKARETFSVQTLPARPYLVLLAKDTASLAVRNGRATRTGPNIYRY